MEIASSSENALASPSEVAGISDSLSAEKHHVDFRVKCLLKRVEWMRELGEAPLSRSWSVSCKLEELLLTDTPFGMPGV